MPEIIQTILTVLDAYIQEFRPELTDDLLYQIVKRIIPKLDNPALLEEEVDQLTELAIAEYRRQGLPIPPQPPDPTSKAVATQVAEEIARFQAEQAAEVNVTEPEVIADLEIGSRLRKMPANSAESSL